MRIISGTAKGKRIFTPVDRKTRPLRDMVKEAIFNIIHHSNLLNSNLSNCTVLDLFSGIGSFGLEAISRGVKKVVFYENYKPAIKLLTKNIKILSFDKQSYIYTKNIYTSRTIEQLNYKFDLIFLDPPFKDEKIEIILEKIKNSKIIKAKTLVVIHRHKNSKDNFSKKLKIIREENYGSSKIIFAYFNL